MDQIEKLLLDEFAKSKRVDIKEEVHRYARHWYWFLLSVLLVVGLAMVKLRYTPNLYKVKTTILIKDGKKGTVASELAAFQDLGAIVGGTSDVDNEIQVLKSRRILKSVVKKLKLNIRYLAKGRMREAELFGKQQPFEFLFDDLKIQHEMLHVLLRVNVLSSTEFELLNEDDELVQKGAFGQEMTGSWGRFMLKANSVTGKEVPRIITVVICPEVSVVNALQGSVQIGVVNKKTSVVSLSLVGRHKQKAIAILDQLVAQYNFDAIEDKNQIAENTAAFIKNRLLIISEDLNGVDLDVAEFKKKNKLTDITSESTLYINDASASEKELLEISTQVKLLDYMLNYLGKLNEKEGLIPANLGLQDEAITIQSNAYNDLILRRNRLLKTSSDINPMVIDLNDNITQIKGNLLRSLQNRKASISFQLRSLKRRNLQLKSQIAKVPEKELLYRDIQRQLQIKEALYLYLLQKREETAISLAVTVANAKIIDEAYGSDSPVSPQKKRSLMIAFFIGLLIPTVIIYLKNYLNTKIKSKLDLEVVDAPFLGDIPLLENGKERLLVNTGADSVSEAFRILRRSVNFFLASKSKKANTIMLGSSVSGEGKTFVALNLASSLALSGKKVLLLELDLRNPNLQNKLNLPANKGFVNAIIDSEQSWETLCYKDVITPNLDVLLAGDIPPNPAELLMHEEVAVFFEEAKSQYDYLVIDTAPVGLVADTLEISTYADLFLFVLRIQHSEKRFLSFIKDLIADGKIKNIGLLLNAINVKKGYGYGYGYGYVAQEKKSKKWYSRWFSNSAPYNE